MNGTKCSGCGLVNLDSDITCRRCGKQFQRYRSSAPVSPRERAVRSSPLLPLLALTVVGAAIYYIYSGAEKSIESVRPAQNIPAANAPNRKEAEAKQSNSFKTAVQNSNSLSETQKHNAEVQKLMQTNR